MPAAARAAGGPRRRPGGRYHARGSSANAQALLRQDLASGRLGAELQAAYRSRICGVCHEARDLRCRCMELTLPLVRGLWAAVDAALAQLTPTLDTLPHTSHLRRLLVPGYAELATARRQLQALTGRLEAAALRARP